jgi:hypothetical protein
MKNTKGQSLALYLPLLVWAAYLVWWLGINFANWSSRDNFTDTYSIIALTGAFSGIMVAKKWGLFKSSFGRALGYLSAGLVMQFFGQLIYGLYFRLGNVELAFPSVGDIPFLFTGIFYGLGVYNLLKVIVFKGGIFKPRTVLFLGVIATISTLCLAYAAFLHLAIHDERGAIYSVVNAAYPLIQVFYFLLGLVALMQAKRIAGGKMFYPVVAVLVALVAQYLADFSFLYQSYHDTWEAASSNDLFYVIAYGLMAYAILTIDKTRRKVLNSPVENATKGSS